MKRAFLMDKEHAKEKYHCIGKEYYKKRTADLFSMIKILKEWLSNIKDFKIS